LQPNAPILVLNPGVGGQLVANKVAPAVVRIANDKLRRSALQRRGGECVGIGCKYPTRIPSNLLSDASFPVPRLLPRENSASALHIPEHVDLQTRRLLRGARA